LSTLQPQNKKEKVKEAANDQGKETDEQHNEKKQQQQQKTKEIKIVSENKTTSMFCRCFMLACPQL
jgi:hypothetical protein